MFPLLRHATARPQVAFRQLRTRKLQRLQPPLRRALTGQTGPPTPGNDAPNPVDDATEHSEAEAVEQQQERSDKQKANDKTKWKSTAWRMFEAAATTGASIFILGLVGFSYTRYYKYQVLEKMENAFRPGDPVLELAAKGKEVPARDIAGEERLPDDYERWIPREEQDKIDKIVSGEGKGRYYLLIGEKGTGKSSMLIDAMSKIEGEGVAMCEAHADPEIFRIRLGRCLDFEFHEDNIGALFSIRGPRDASALLDIERAFNKLEKVALRRRKRIGRPLILIINQAHLIRDDEDGRDLIELIQQRAEQWAASNLATVIINSDKYWVYERLKQHGTRLEVIQVSDLSKFRALQALRNYRLKYYDENTEESVLEEVYEKIGGRLTFLNRVARSVDMMEMCDKICEIEKTWFLNNCGILGMEMDDDVMDQQKYASSAMVLALALHKKAQKMEKKYNPDRGHILPEFPLHKARYIMTRADFIRQHHELSIFAIDSHANVRADSVPMQRAFDQICSEPGFEKKLEDTLERIGDIESLGRTKELTFKDLWEGGKYRITTRDRRGNVQNEVEMVTVEKQKKDDDDDEGDDDD